MDQKQRMIKNELIKLLRNYYLTKETQTDGFLDNVYDATFKWYDNYVPRHVIIEYTGTIEDLMNRKNKTNVWGYDKDKSELTDISKVLFKENMTTTQTTTTGENKHVDIMNDTVLLLKSAMITRHSNPTPFFWGVTSDMFEKTSYYNGEHVCFVMSPTEKVPVNDNIGLNYDFHNKCNMIKGFDEATELMASYLKNINNTSVDEALTKDKDNEDLFLINPTTDLYLAIMKSGIFKDDEIKDLHTTGTDPIPLGKGERTMNFIKKVFAKKLEIPICGNLEFRLLPLFDDTDLKRSDYFMDLEGKISDEKIKEWKNRRITIYLEANIIMKHICSIGDDSDSE